MLGLERINRARHAGFDVTKGAGPRAHIAKDHDGGMLFGPTFAYVGTSRLFANGIEVEITHQSPRLVKSGTSGRFHPDPVRLTFSDGAFGQGNGCVHFVRIALEHHLANCNLPAMGCKIRKGARMIIDTLTSPVILFFVLGFVAAALKSDLTIPEAFAKAMSIYLMAAIGLKGGVEVSKSGITSEVLIAAAAGLALSFLLPVLAFALLRTVGKLSKVDAGAVAAHYGSVSVVTFVTAVELLTGQGLSPAGYMVAVLALMETPAIITGLMLADRGDSAGNADERTSTPWHEVLTNASVMLLVGSFVIGAIAGSDGFAPVKPLFDTGFRGVLCLFLLDMGLIAARRLMQSRKMTLRLVSLAIVLPLVNGTIGTVVGTLIGLDVASAAALGILTASASYIAVPAAMRLALPQADPGIYLSMSLGVTFPFNIIFGISIFAALAEVLG